VGGSAHSVLAQVGGPCPPPCWARGSLGQGAGGSMDPFTQLG